MALKPVLKLKVDELFLRWLSEPDTQNLLKNNLKQIIKGETITDNKAQWPQSPRLNSPAQSTPPCSPTTAKVMSPRSPRRAGIQKALIKQLNNNNSTTSKAPKDEAVFATSAKDSKSGSQNQHQRGEPDGEAETFLRQKEAQLREKRERERQQKEREKLHQQSQQHQQQTVHKQESKKESEKDTSILKEREKDKDSKLLKSIENKPKKKETVAQQKNEEVFNKTPTKTTLKGSTLRTSHRNSSLSLPQFYFPMGHPPATDEAEKVLLKVKEAFTKVEGGKLSKANMGSIAKAAGFPLYWKGLLFSAAGGEKTGHVTLQQFLALWKKLTSTCHDDQAKFVRLMAKPGCTYLVAEDFVPLIQDVVDSHPGLTFLQDAPEFHSRYVHTVIARIFYCVNRSWTGRITMSELRKSNILQTLALIEEEDDINQITDFFSYEHFYVIYCKFWELDKDHDLFISKDDLARHNDHAISTRMIDRVFSGAVTRGRAQKEGKMSYTEFVWFLMSEEDKKHPTSIEYWFRCMDLDGDGCISMYEMEYFYEEMVQRMEAMGIETLPFEDCLCQMLDMVKPKDELSITLKDLKTCKMTPLFYDTFFNLEKYLEHEQKDPFASVKDGDEPEMSDWERYAAEEYEILVAEEGANDGGQEEIMYEDDFEPDDEDSPTTPEPTLAPSTDPMASSTPKTSTKGRPKSSSPDDDIYDFTTQDLGY